MGYEDLTPPKEQPKVESGKLEIEEDRKEYLKTERENHAGITPAFRTLGEIEKKLLPNFSYNSIRNVKFLLPLTDLSDLNYKMQEGKGGVVVSVYLGNKVAFEATFFQDDKLEEKNNNEQVDHKEVVSEGEDMRKILPQEGDIVMIDKIRHLDDIKVVSDSKVISTRKVDEADFEGGKEFNKFRLIEMIGQAGSYYFLSNVNNREKKGKMMATYKMMNVNFFDAVKDINKDNELIIEVKQNEPDKLMKRARGEVRKEDGTVICECFFGINEPMKRKNLSRYAKQKSEEVGA